MRLRRLSKDQGWGSEVGEWKYTVSVRKMGSNWHQGVGIKAKPLGCFPHGSMC